MTRIANVYITAKRKRDLERYWARVQGACIDQRPPVPRTPDDEQALLDTLIRALIIKN